MFTFSKSVILASSAEFFLCFQNMTFDEKAFLLLDTCAHNLSESCLCYLKPGWCKKKKREIWVISPKRTFVLDKYIP